MPARLHTNICTCKHTHTHTQNETDACSHSILMTFIKPQVHFVFRSQSQRRKRQKKSPQRKQRRKRKKKARLKRVKERRGLMVNSCFRWVSQITLLFILPKSFQHNQASRVSCRPGNIQPQALQDVFHKKMLEYLCVLFFLVWRAVFSGISQSEANCSFLFSLNGTVLVG